MLHYAFTVTESLHDSFICPLLIMAFNLALSLLNNNLDMHYVEYAVN